MSSPPTILVLGIGNYLMGDEGVGVHAIRALEREKVPPGVSLLDGGTGGFHLLSYLQEYPTVLLIDATMDGGAPGTVHVLRPKFASDFPRALSAHDIGLRDLIESTILTGKLPDIHLVTVSIADLNDMTTELTPAVNAAIPSVVSSVMEILRGALPESRAREAP
ncbi:MAG TPA: HyaD/HybD family hydrogenase maturation endopeptidase [Bacteroidota bacterium]|nr:HyaD/HybD family hydrogenase maturation endopeptidase [Bacteroidota bacterium]